MAFRLQIGFTSHQTYVREYIRRFFEREGVIANVTQDTEGITVEADAASAALAPALIRLGEQLPYSVFMGLTHHETTDAPFEPWAAEAEDVVPHGLGVCPQCRSEMLDPKSRRYYYPFTSCAACGPQYAFSEKMPFIRPNTVFSYVQPCAACREELTRNPLRRDYPLIGCQACGIPLEMVHRGKSRYANDPATFKQLFEIAAKTINEGKTLLMKTAFGFRRFYRPDTAEGSRVSVLMHTDPVLLGEDFALTPLEVQALASLEKPLLKVALKNETIKANLGNAVYAKLPDEGMSILLARELQALGLSAVAYEPVDADADADYRVTFDLPINVQDDLIMAINQEGRCVVAGERAIFPVRLPIEGDTLGIAGALAAVGESGTHLVDRIERFEQAETSHVMVMEGSENPVAHANTHGFAASHGALMSALYSRGLQGQRAVSVYFEGPEICFDFYNGHTVTTVVPPIPFESAGLTERLSTLREGSERLMGNLAKNAPELLELLGRIEAEEIPFFEAVALLCGAGEHGFESLDNAALAFVGKGGTQVDCRKGDTRFNPYTVLASVLSYRAAGVESVMLSYSFFESMGDYFIETLQQFVDKADVPHVMLCGRYVAQTSLLSRIRQKMKSRTPMLNRSFPVGSDGAVVGSLLL